jgi:hypothetical protein
MRHGKSVLFVLSILSAPAVLAWDSPGHETVAAIAWKTMLPATQKKVSAILQGAQKNDCLQELGAGGDPRAYFIRAATWPDVVRPNDKKDKHGKVIEKDPRTCTQFHVRDDHFRDQFWSGMSDGKGPDAPTNRSDVAGNARNAVERLSTYQPLVACKPKCQISSFERAHDLAWMLHLVGDVHQPLHNAGRVSPQNPKGDGGGNLFPLKVDGEKPSNLHSFWDDIVDHTIEQKNGEADIAYIDRLAARLMADHPRKDVTAAQLASGQFDRWSEEGFGLAKQLAYPRSLQVDKSPSADYRKTAFTTADKQIALAGYRLADLLDRMLK